MLKIFIFSLFATLVTLRQVVGTSTATSSVVADAYMMASPVFCACTDCVDEVKLEAVCRRTVRRHIAKCGRHKDAAKNWYDTPEELPASTRQQPALSPAAAFPPAAFAVDCDVDLDPVTTTDDDYQGIDSPFADDNAPNDFSILTGMWAPCDNANVFLWTQCVTYHLLYPTPANTGTGGNDCLV